MDFFSLVHDPLKGRRAGSGSQNLAVGEARCLFEGQQKSEEWRQSEFDRTAPLDECIAALARIDNPSRQDIARLLKDIPDDFQLLHLFHADAKDIASKLREGNNMDYATEHERQQALYRLLCSLWLDWYISVGQRRAHRIVQHFLGCEFEPESFEPADRQPERRGDEQPERPVAERSSWGEWLRSPTGMATGVTTAAAVGAFAFLVAKSLRGRR